MFFLLITQNKVSMTGKNGALACNCDLTSLISCAVYNAVSGVCSAGFRTITLPQHKAGAIFQANISNGKFHWKDYKKTEQRCDLFYLKQLINSYHSLADCGLSCLIQFHLKEKVLITVFSRTVFAFRFELLLHETLQANITKCVLHEVGLHDRAFFKGMNYNHNIMYNIVCSLWV